MPFQASFNFVVPWKTGIRSEIPWVSHRIMDLLDTPVNSSMASAVFFFLCNISRTNFRTKLEYLAGILLYTSVEKKVEIMSIMHFIKYTEVSY